MSRRSNNTNQYGAENRLKVIRAKRRNAIINICIGAFFVLFAITLFMIVRSVAKGSESSSQGSSSVISSTSSEGSSTSSTGESSVSEGDTTVAESSSEDSNTTAKSDSQKDDSQKDGDVEINDLFADDKSSSSKDARSSSSSSKVSDKIGGTDKSSSSSKDSSSKPMLVNRDNKVPDGYVPKVTSIGAGYQLETKAAAAFLKMQNAAADSGVSIYPVSAYRSQERQVVVFNNKVQEYKNQGLDDDEAYVQASGYVAIPGTSEHSLGLAVDINSLEESFENTKAFSWLYKNCAKYGFILRYPKDKTKITKINYEPWHYRYVGVDIAKEIMSKKQCLEEYLGQ